MNYLKHKRAALENLLPALDAALAQLLLMQMERRANPSINAFRQLGGPDCS